LLVRTVILVIRIDLCDGDPHANIRSSEREYPQFRTRISAALNANIRSSEREYPRLRTGISASPNANIRGVTTGVVEV
ncbi:MAG: hypothetical protein LBH80_05210, partial [Prevotellaceae bacterium]|nr:hypothetical protein [Prevotellaceae bacterium]